MFELSSKRTDALLPTDILFQTGYWAQVKARLGYTPKAFDLAATERHGDVLVLLQPMGRGRAMACVPQGPEHAPAAEDYGPFLEDLSEALARSLGPSVAFIRYDLPWASPYADDMRTYGSNAYPEPRIREMRMNMGTRNWNLKKAHRDMTVASSLVVDLTGTEQDILARMKPKTRYNIGLAARKGVRVDPALPDMLPVFHGLYRQTALRNGFAPCGYEQFRALFRARMHALNPTGPLAPTPPDSTPANPICPDRAETTSPGRDAELLFLLARHGADVLAGAIVALCGATAHFLYGASADHKRQYMAPYAMHWKAMRLARQRGCAAYDMGAVPPGLDPAHPFHGLHRFKTGFGGRVELRSGSWDYPIDHAAHRDFCNLESLERHRPS
ncbi:lipid II:glycine glycyltransferase FemX [Nitratidesulfovibrio sp. D1]|uniref:lipid II:glycine glycyltransferase FemX n=1 Tax=Nitratidesulfovibrio sp. D1 TaxID=3440151 RepID=UPI003EC108CD